MSNRSPFTHPLNRSDFFCYTPKFLLLDILGERCFCVSLFCTCCVCFFSLSPQALASAAALASRWEHITSLANVWLGKVLSNTAGRISKTWRPLKAWMTSTALKSCTTGPGLDCTNTPNPGKPWARASTPGDGRWPGRAAGLGTTYGGRPNQITTTCRNIVSAWSLAVYGSTTLARRGRDLSVTMVRKW